MMRTSQLRNILFFIFIFQIIPLHSFGQAKSWEGECTEPNCEYKFTIIRNNNWKQGVLDAHGKEIIPIIFDQIYAIHHGAEHLLEVKLGDYCAVYTIDGKPVIPIDRKYNHIDWVRYREEQGNGSYFIAYKNLSKNSECSVYLIDALGREKCRLEMPIGYWDQDLSIEYRNFNNYSVFFTWCPETDQTCLLYGNGDTRPYSNYEYDVFIKSTPLNQLIVDKRGIVACDKVIIPLHDIPESIDFLNNNLNYSEWLSMGKPIGDNKVSSLKGTEINSYIPKLSDGRYEIVSIFFKSTQTAITPKTKNNFVVVEGSEIKVLLDNKEFQSVKLQSPLKERGVVYEGKCVIGDIVYMFEFTPFYGEKSGAIVIDDTVYEIRIDK